MIVSSTRGKSRVSDHVARVVQAARAHQLSQLSRAVEFLGSKDVLRTPGFKGSSQGLLDLNDEIIVDLFCGGGGASEGIEIARGVPVNDAVNHDPSAILLHLTNHPGTVHHTTGVHDVCPRKVAGRRRVGHLHASPDCTHFSQSKNGQPRSRAIRSLAWVVHRWAGTVAPRFISLENVEQMTEWTRLVAKRDPASGRVVKLDGSVAAKGERVPVEQQFLVPDRRTLGRTFKHFVELLKAKGYQVDYRTLVAADYGAPTTRERLYLIARNDGLPLVWPSAQFHKSPRPGQQAWRGAHECIDWTLPGRTIFDRKKPLADATHRRIARGIQRFIISASDPFIVSHPTEGAGTVSSPVFVQAGHGEGKPGARRWSYGCKSPRDPLGTITASGGGQALAVASMRRISAAHLMTLRRYSTGVDARQPLPTIAAKGEHHAVVQCELEAVAAADRAGAIRCSDFLAEQLGPESGIRSGQPVVISIAGEMFAIVDITLRMLQPKELYAAQGFPSSYVFDRAVNGRPFTKTEQIRMCGNSVSPMVMAAIVAANDWSWIPGDQLREAA